MLCLLEPMLKKYAEVPKQENLPLKEDMNG